MNRWLVLTAAAIIIGASAVMAQAQSAEVIEVALDTNVTGNTATSVGTRQACASIQRGQTVQVDVTVQNIPPWVDHTGTGRPGMGDSGGIMAFEVHFWYDPGIVRVVGVNNQFLLAANDWAPFDLSFPVPDDDGYFVAAVLDLSQGAPEHGSGVLTRITLEATADGLATLEIPVITVNNASAVEYHYPPVAPARIAVGQPCPAADPTPAPGTPGPPPPIQDLPRTPPPVPPPPDRLDPENFPDLPPELFPDTNGGAPAADGPNAGDPTGPGHAPGSDADDPSPDDTHPDGRPGVGGTVPGADDRDGTTGTDADGEPAADGDGAAPGAGPDGVLRPGSGEDGGGGMGLLAWTGIAVAIVALAAAGTAGGWYWLRRQGLM